MDRIAAMARKHQPGILLVDRMAKGPFENYQTPEGEIPPKQLNIPWETCLSMNGWGWRSEGEYKSSKKIISVLIEVVAKGGNLLLGIGPTAEGLIDNIVAERVLTIGKWLEKMGKLFTALLRPNITMMEMYGLPAIKINVPCMLVMR